MEIVEGENCRDSSGKEREEGNETEKKRIEVFI